MPLDVKRSAPEGRREQQVYPEDKAMLALQDKLDRLLAKAKPSKRELTQQRFKDLYPRLEAYLASGKPLKDVLAAFNELAQSKVCARTFEKMLEQERARRDEAGNPICCVSCGQRLLPTPQSVALGPNVSGVISDSADRPPAPSE